jgi:hypothetical protein
MTRLKTIFKDANVDVENKRFSISVSESCFEITISANKFNASKAKVEMSIMPEIPDTYELIVERDKWREEEVLISLTLDDLNFGIELALNVRDILAPQDLSVSTGFRNFKVLTSSREFFVNVTQLKELGGRMFKDWYTRECQGESSVVVQQMDANELAILLEACCAYSTPIVHRRNFRQILSLAEREKIVGLLRIIESFLIESESVHQIRKLELAAEYRMSRLADSVLRSFPSKVSRLNGLFDYLSQNGESLEDVHMDVLEMLEIHSDHIVL